MRKNITTIVLLILALFVLSACGSKSKVSDKLTNTRYSSSWSAFGSNITVEYKFGEKGALTRDRKQIYPSGETEHNTSFGYFEVQNNEIKCFTKSDASEEKFSEQTLTYSENSDGTLTLYDSSNRAYKRR